MDDARQPTVHGKMTKHVKYKELFAQWDSAPNNDDPFGAVGYARNPVAAREFVASGEPLTGGSFWPDDALQLDTIAPSATMRLQPRSEGLYYDFPAPKTKA